MSGQELAGSGGLGSSPRTGSAAQAAQHSTLAHLAMALFAGSINTPRTTAFKRSASRHG